jgi:hypothetical protein
MWNCKFPHVSTVMWPSPGRRVKNGPHPPRLGLYATQGVRRPGDFLVEIGRQPWRLMTFQSIQYARILLANSKPLSFSTLIFIPAQERLD